MITSRKINRWNITLQLRGMYCISWWLNFNKEYGYQTRGMESRGDFSYSSNFMNIFKQVLDNVFNFCNKNKHRKHCGKDAKCLIIVNQLQIRDLWGKRLGFLFWWSGRAAGFTISTSRFPYLSIFKKGRIMFNQTTKPKVSSSTLQI